MPDSEPVPWFEDEAFWAASFPFMFPANRLEGAGEEVERIIALCGIDHGHVLDLGCGPGRHAVHLAKRGFRVTGVDRSAFLLDQARERGRTDGLDVEWIAEDMRAFRRPSAFDVAISMFTSFGYFELEEENLAVLQNLHASLKPDGVLVMDVMGKEILARGFQPTGSQEVPGAGVAVQRRAVVNDWSAMSNEWILIKDSAVQRFHLWHRVYSGVELKALLLGAGFGTVVLHGDLSGTPYDPSARRLVAVARKAA